MEISMLYHCFTQTTRDMLEGRKPPRVNMTNGKPYRTAQQKQEARTKARLCSDGTYRSAASVSFHAPTPVR